MHLLIDTPESRIASQTSTCKSHVKRLVLPFSYGLGNSRSSDILCLTVRHSFKIDDTDAVVI